MKEVLRDIYVEYEELTARIDTYDKKVNKIARENDICNRLQTIPGIGPITAASLYASIGNGSQFKNGREMAAHIGLVPRQHSSGERHRLFGVSNMGNKKLKELLIHGGRAVVRTAGKKTDKRSAWVIKLAEKKHSNVVATAVANRMARIAWAIASSSNSYNDTGFAKQASAGAC